jgi:hypothetical protein
MAVKPSSAKTRENAIEAALVRGVRALGGRCEKVTVLGSRGFFDRLVVLPGGRIIFVELKRPTGGVWAVHQKCFAQEYHALGAEVALVKNLADVERLLAGGDRNIPP